jgi:hypothetical protein
VAAVIQDDENQKSRHVQTCLLFSLTDVTHLTAEFPGENLGVLRALCGERDFAYVR